MKKAIEYLLLKSDVTNYQISKATGIGQNVLSNYAIGKSSIGNMSLNNALKIHEFYKEMLKTMENEFGSVTVEGKEYTLVQKAHLDYINIPHGEIARLVGDFYRANALDSDGGEHLVLWSPVEGYESMEDGSDHCNWSKPDWVLYNN